MRLNCLLVSQPWLSSKRLALTCVMWVGHHSSRRREDCGDGGEVVADCQDVRLCGGALPASGNRAFTAMA